MRLNKRLQSLGEYINDSFFKGELDFVAVYSMNLNKKKNRKIFAKWYNYKHRKKIEKCANCFYGVSSFDYGIILNSYHNPKGSLREYGTLIHEYIHQWQDLHDLDDDKDIHGYWFTRKAFEIGEEMGWSDKQTREYII